jgi:ABC-type multidrug transport system fused ATPase/permease subunit
MRTYPTPEDQVPPMRASATLTPTGFMLWVARGQSGSILSGAWWGSLWMLGAALIPVAVGEAIDRGIVAHDSAALADWGAGIVAMAALIAFAGGRRHANAVTNWLAAAYTVLRLATREAVRIGADLPRSIASGEMITIGSSDAEAMANFFDVLARLAGSIVSVAVLAAIMLDASVQLGLVVLIGVPATMAAIAWLQRPLQRRQEVYRDRQSRLNAQAVDIAHGIRILRAIGGEAAFAARYRRASAQVLAGGLGVGSVEALLAGETVLFPGLLSTLVTWLAAISIVRGHLSAGQLVAFYGYTAFLTLPVAVFSEAIGALGRARVASRRIIRLLQVRPGVDDPAEPVACPAPGAELADAVSGVRIGAGELLGVVCAGTVAAGQLAERLARYRDGPEPGAVTLGGTPLSRIRLESVRTRILLLRNTDRFFPGSLRESLSGASSPADTEIQAALYAAAAEDVLAGLGDDGLDAAVADAGRNFSGGQLQRLRLARALLAAPDILVAVEATSAVDALTEARVADRLGGYRAGRATVLFSTSPLVLNRCDRVVFLRDGRQAASGTHARLLAEQPDYHRLVVRQAEGVPQ